MTRAFRARLPHGAPEVSGLVTVPYGATSADAPRMTCQEAGDRAETQEASAVRTSCLNLSRRPAPGASGSTMSSSWGRRWKGTETQLGTQAPWRPTPPPSGSWVWMPSQGPKRMPSLVLWAWYRAKRGDSVNASEGLGVSPTFQSCISPLRRLKVTVSQFRRLQSQGQGASRGISF